MVHFSVKLQFKTTTKKGCFRFHEIFLLNLLFQKNRFEHILTLTGQLVNLKGNFKDRIQLSQMQEKTDPVIILTDKTMTPLSKVP